jgi:siroheme synthase-like protein
VKRFYPAFLDLTGKEALLVGGGAVALQKARALTAAGAKVTAVSPEALPALKRMRNVRWLKRAFRDADIAAGRPWIAVAATDDEALNARISRLAAARRLWANVVDRPALCGFIVPSTARRGPVTFAVSTGGASPALAKFLIARVKASFGPELGAAARLLGRLRPRMKRLPLAARARLVEKALAGAARDGFSPAALRRMERRILTEIQGA